MKTSVLQLIRVCKLNDSIKSKQINLKFSLKFIELKNSNFDF